MGQEAKERAPRAKTRLPDSFWLGLPAFVAFVLYLPFLENGPIADDTALLLTNPFLRDGPGLAELWSRDLWAGTALRLPTQYFRPLTMSSYWAQTMLHGPSIPWLRFGNVLTFAALAFALPRLLLRLEPKLSPRLAGCLGLLWAVHPLNSEAVLWLSGRFDLFAIGATLALFSANESRKNAFLVPLVTGLGLLTKEVAIAALPALFFFDLARRRPARALLVKWLGVTLVVATYLSVRAGLGIYGAAEVLTGLPGGAFASGFSSLLVTYGKELFVPSGLDLFHRAPSVPGSVGVLLLMIALGLVTLSCVVAFRRKTPLLGAGALLAFVSLALATPILMSQEVFGDRFAAQALIGLAFIAGSALRRVRDEGRLVPAFLLVAGLGAPLTFLRGREWESESTLANGALRRDPTHPEWLLRRAREDLREGRLANAVAALERLVTQYPKMGKAQNALCVAELRSGALERATNACGEATRLEPKNPSTWLNQASVLAARGEWPEVLRAAARALEENPEYVEAHYLMAVAFLNLGSEGLAREHLREGLRLLPTHPGLRRLDEQLKRKGVAPPRTRDERLDHP